MGEREGDCGKRQGFEASEQAVLPTWKTTCGEPTQVDRENQNQHHREPEIRDRDAKLCGPHDADIAKTTTSRGCIDARWKSDQGGERERVYRQRQRYPKPILHHIRNGRSIGIGRAKIALKHPESPRQIALQLALVQAKFLAQSIQRVFLCIDAKHKGRRITRRDLNHQKNDEAGDDQADRKRQQAFERVAQHFSTLGERGRRVQRACRGVTTLYVVGHVASPAFYRLRNLSWFVLWPCASLARSACVDGDGPCPRVELAA